MPEAIIKDWCPKCRSINYVNNGDITDLSQPDIDGIKCHKCKHEWAFDAYITDANTDMDGLWIEDGDSQLTLYKIK